MFSISKQTKLLPKDGKNVVRINPNYFLLFGLGDLILSDNCNTSKVNHSDLGCSFVLPGDITKSSLEAKYYLAVEEFF